MDPSTTPLGNVQGRHSAALGNPEGELEPTHYILVKGVI